MIHNRGYWLSQEEFDTHQFDEKLANAIAKTFCVATAVDIGCGNGSYTTALNAKGINCIGYDGSPLTSCDNCKIQDFSVPVDVGRFDLVLCLEVGEHIPAEYEQVFIDNVCKAAKQYICLSWAVVGQGGAGHVNCRNNDHVIYEMAKRGFRIEADTTEFLRDTATLSWFKNTIMVFEKW